MVQPAPNPHLVCFGLFELDLDARELRKSGVKVKLQEQPFLVLALLLERPGTMVTREEIQKKLWPHDTFVDFDVSLNSAVKKLRQALNDDSENPRFIETLYRRGYRFIAPVDRASTAETSQPVERQPQPAASAAHGRSRSWLWAVVAAFALALLLFVAFLWLRPPLPAPRVLSATQITHDNLPKNQLVTDGPRLYFTEELNDHQVLSQVSTEGGEVARIPLPFSDVSVFDLSPTASELLVQSFTIQNTLMSTNFTGPLWMVPLPAGSPHRVGNLMAAGAAFSPDGKNLVYVDGQDLYLAQADGTSSRKLGSVTGSPFTPRFSPDGATIRFTVLDRNIGSAALWEIAADGTGLRPLLPGWHRAANPCCGVWTLDGKYFLFHAHGEVWALPDRVGLLHKKTSEPLQVTSGPLDYFATVPSRDGRKLFVVGEQPRAELLHYDARARQFLPFLSGISAGQVDFSPDGKFVAYVSYPDGALWQSRADGSEPRQLTSPPLVASLPRWAPDGKRIAFSAGTESDPMLKAFVISADGGAPQELLRDASRELADANWAPDGNSLIYAHSPTFGGTDTNDFVLVRFDLKTGQLSDVPGSRGMYAPRWSPDGRYLAALTPNQDKVMLLRLDTGQWSVVASGQDIEYPNWSRDSQNLFFESTADETRTLFRVHIPTRRTERVVSLAGIRRPEVQFGVQWLGLAPDQSALIMRDVGIREIYALTLDRP